MIVLSPSLDLSTYESANLSFSVECDTEYITDGWADYIAVEMSTDGLNFIPIEDPFYDLETWYIDEPYIDGFWDNDPTGSSSTTYSIPLPSAALTSTFSLRYRWITNSTDNNHAGCNIDEVAIDTFSDGFDEDYGSLSGTSMAAPHVAGVAALLLAQEPTLSTAQLKEIILTGGDAIPALSDTTLSGKRLNAFGALSTIGTTKTIIDFQIPGSLMTEIDSVDNTITAHVPEASHPLITPS